jgi:hypothetical protein
MLNVRYKEMQRDNLLLKMLPLVLGPLFLHLDLLLLDVLLCRRLLLRLLLICSLEVFLRWQAFSTGRLFLLLYDLK